MKSEKEPEESTKREPRLEKVKPWSKRPIKTELEKVWVPVLGVELKLWERTPTRFEIHFGGEAEKYARAVEIARSLEVKRIEVLRSELCERMALSEGEASRIIQGLRDEDYLKVVTKHMKDGTVHFTYEVPEEEEEGR